MVSGGVVGWEKAEDVLCLSLYACPKMHYVMIMQGATHREARAVGGEPASSSAIIRGGTSIDISNKFRKRQSNYQISFISTS